MKQVWILLQIELYKLKKLGQDTCGELASACAEIASWQVSGGIAGDGFIPPRVGKPVDYWLCGKLEASSLPLYQLCSGGG
jgi:hypothetical protein